MISVGRLCIKIAGRDSNKKCVIVDMVDKNIVLIDGQTRRKKCNISHLEPLKDSIKIKKGAPHSEIVKEFKKLNIEIKERKAKKKQPRPKKKRKSSQKPDKPKETKK